MRIDSRFPPKLGLFQLLVVIALILTACSSKTLSQFPTLQATDALSRPTYIPSPYPAATPEVTATVEITSTPPSDFKLEAFEIESGYSDKAVVAAFWSDDRKLVYYAFASALGEKPLKWATYDVTTHITMAISSPLKFDSQIWQRLNVPDPLDNLALYPELSGYMSPGGAHVIFTVSRVSQSDPNSVTEIWIADSNARHKTKLLERFPGIISQAVWLKNETKVIFDFGSEGGARLYIADVQNGTVVPLADISDFKRGTEEHWTVSPDGATLAIIDFQGMLWLISLEDGKSRVIEKSARYPYWSKDGKVLYYWWGPSYRETHTLHSYDITSGNISTVANESSLANIFSGLPEGNFAISPDGNKIVFWGGWLWLVELRK